MRQWLQLWKKECLEMWRNFKWIWIPLVFIILGMIDPLTTYYMPIIMDAVGNLPEGTVFEMPIPSAAEVFMMSTGEFNMLGLLVIVLASMGLIASERRSGVAGLILIRPVPFMSYVTAKWAGLLILGWFALFLGFLSSWYYTGLLFEPINFAVLIKSFLLFGLWYSFVLTLTVFFNAVFKVPGLVAFVSLLSVIILSITTNIFEQWMAWSPARLTYFVGEIVVEGRLSTNFPLVLIVTIIGIITLLTAATLILQKKELAE